MRFAMVISGPRVLLCSILGGIGIYIGVGCARFMDSGASVYAPVPSAARAEIQLPDPRLSPAEVVRLQVDALRAFRSDQSAISQCYALASPANRAVTGPLDRFTAMVQNPTYRSLVIQTSALVGQELVRGGQATVLVTVLDESRTPHGFRFFLSKQADQPYVNCWMTDAVLPERPLPSQPAPAPPSTSAA
jgi:hypothetical protein